MLLGILGVLLVPALATAHPLGNFTINHYTGIRVEPDRILLDVVIDQAEIPTFQARLDFDTDGDGEVSDAETDAGRVTACDGLEPSLALKVGGAASNLTLTEAGLTFPPGSVACRRCASCAASAPTRARSLRALGSTTPTRPSANGSAGARSSSPARR